MSCLSKLFDVEEYKIQEDFLQMSELVDTAYAFMNRSTAIYHTNRSLSENYLFYFLPYELAESYQTFFTEYHGSPAFLSEMMPASLPFLFVYKDLKRYKEYYEKMDFWILGASHNNPLKIDAKDDVECGGHSCYEHSLKSGKICKQGMFIS